MKAGDTVILRTFHKVKILEMLEDGDMGPSPFVEFPDGARRVLDKKDVLRVQTQDDLKGECT